jgi:hypothetical protein
MSNATFRAVSELPELDNPLISQPDHIVNPFPGSGRSPAHRFTLLRGEGRWAWAHVLRAMTGWAVISAGVLSTSIFPTADEAGEYLVRQFLGDTGDGHDYLSHEAFLQVGQTAHIRDEDEPHTGYCGAQGGGPAVFDMDQPDHVVGICIRCDRAYRAVHYGRMPVTH